ncbi:MAG: Ribonucleotide reductase alpha subunit containing intein NrdA [Candidatus Methanohalarchaeum thermophilum]|uniref:Vitamin B12-dependent ribonucleotide reductase n=1 Tax=Methanohalarchaeum thermophilum TaxID=1903181 RepID=A0A1Q6DTF2_METT1|nr:MAG: Ribonucleotide reductase alpha subunit containing intein NrdA [Candidatus Methanohalarchaeum thermophilum]
MSGSIEEENKLPINEESLTENAKRILEKRYLVRDEDRNIKETPKELFERVAQNVASANEKYNDDRTVEKEKKEFYQALSNLAFIPNSPTLMNAGTEIQQLAACFVLPVEDTMEGIYETVKDTALVHKSGGGTGFAFSRLRPEGDVVQSTGGIASGPISFMKVFNQSTDTIKQGGKRRGANMGILHVSHPDIKKFVEAKDNEEALTNFNISVSVDNKFMEAVKNEEEYPLKNPKNGEITEYIDAKKLFNKIAKQAWKNGEPGMIFLDKINEDNPFPSNNPKDKHYIESTNPCGEQPLEPYEACNLGHVNLSKAVRDGEVDWEYLDQIVDLGVRFLDNVIDVSDYPIDKIEEKVEANRKIGLGVMGFHDMLIELGVPYDSDEAVEKAQEVMKFINSKARKVSRRIAEERGAFPNFDESNYDEPIRNSTLTTIAPTGTTGMIADVSNGIEPIFAVSYAKNVLNGEQLVEVNDKFIKIAKERGFYSKELEEKVKEKDSIQDMEEIPEDVKELFKISLDIDPEWHIKIQAAFQKHTDNAVSKTINFPNDADMEDIASSYLLSYELGCKGITVYRDGSRSEQVIETEESSKEKGLAPRSRPDVLEGETEKVKVGCGKSLYVTATADEDGVFEVFTQLGKSGGCVRAFTEANARLISLALRSGVDPEEIIKQLKGIRCPSPRFDGGGEMILSCPDALAKSMERFISSEEDYDLDVSVEKGRNPECPECGGPLVYEEGCATCKLCGYSDCS